MDQFPHGPDRVVGLVEAEDVDFLPAEILTEEQFDGVALYRDESRARSAAKILAERA